MICKDLRTNVERTDPGYGAFSMLRQIMTEDEEVKTPPTLTLTLTLTLMIGQDARGNESA